MADEYNDPIKHIDEAPSDPYGIESTEIDVGIRKTLNTCQYWIKGLPGVCKHWQPGDPGNCTYEEYNQRKQRIYPSGWNLGHCDFLGRRGSCNKYILGDGGEDLDQYICIAPNPFISGQFKDVDGVKRAVTKSEIKGYNAGSDFVGRCDGCGFGRGPNGYTVSDQGDNCASDAFSKLPPICNYYKPWHMGFGFPEPKTTKITDDNIDKEGRIIRDTRDEMEERLPLSFRVYNLRAKLQKCAYWDRKEGSDFTYSAAGLSLEDDEDFCINTDSAVTPYHTVDTNAFAGYSGYQILENVWSEAGCIVCNGAKSECPGYTGRWVYCTDEKLEKGDKVSAHQILELRFWMNDWASQTEYDSVFKRPPNKDDPSTSSIYTYGKWDVISSEPTDSILSGKKVDLCVPYTRQEFSSDLIQSEDVTYRNRKTQEKSTVAPGQVSYPNLVRDIEYINIPPLNIIYPYASKDPFNLLLNPVCRDQDTTPCVKRNYSIEGDEVTVVGYTLPGKELYAFNITQTGASSAIDLVIYDTVLAIDTPSRKRTFYNQMDDLVEYLKEEKNELLHTTTSDENGLFYIGPIKLDYQKLNYLVVCFEFEGGWIFRKRVVWSQWHGGVVAQCDAAGGKAFEHKYEEDMVYADDGYSLFTPSATATGKLFPLYGHNAYSLSTEVRSLFNANMAEVYAGLIGVHYNYSYCFKKITKKNVNVSRWRRADLAGSLWIEVEDTNLNYIFNWNIKSAKVYIEDEAGNIIESVSMHKVFPFGVHEQINIHPSACIISPSDGKKRGFFSADGWLIKVDYWYITIANDNNTTPPDDNTEVEIIYPNFDLASTRFISSGNYDIELQGNDFSVSNIIKDTVALLAIFNDDEGRPISTMATKMCVDVARVFARDVEIYYSWSGDYQTYHLEPTSGFLRVDQDGPFRIESKGYTSMGSRAPCGDHELGFFSNVGPMWYPYNSCETTDFYDLWTGANFCVTPHEGTPRMDYRFMGPERYTPFCWPHSTLWTCAEDWGCGHHELMVGSVRFTGYARKRGALNPDLYRIMEWEFPKFGNVLREYVERFKSIDNVSHISMKNQAFSPGYAWMPLVMDDDALYFSFNCLSGNTITFVNPLNFWLITTDVDETIEANERHRFDEVFGIRKTILASYPAPVLEQSSGYPYVAYYYFKDDFFQWAWQEKWLDIERAIGDEDEKMAFVELDYPYYIFSCDKEEHRIVAEEGEYDLVYTAPVADENDKTKLKTYPSIRLGTGPTRYFDPTVASTTYPSLAKWRDEDDGEKDGSIGGDEEGIYEKTTTGGKWLHVNFEPYYSSMIYDSDAVDTEQAAEDANRKVLISYDALLDESEEYTYNRGLIAKISMDRLQYLPYEELIMSEDSYDKVFTPVLEDEEAPYTWYDTNSPSITFDFGEDTFCISRVVITGLFGNVNIEVEDGDETKLEKRHLHQPEIRASEGGSDLGTTRVLYMTDDEMRGGIGTSTWQEEIIVTPTPSRMLENRSNQFKIQFSLSTKSVDGVSITKIELYEARYKDYTEHIKVWERKYNTSIGDPGNYNLDGINRVLSYDGNYDNSGIYFFEQAHPISGPVRAYNKMRRVRGGEHKEDMEAISVYNYASVIKAEQEQQILYEAALSYEPTNVTIYRTVLPPKVEQFLLDTKAATYSLVNFTVTMESDKTRWGNHWATAGYQAYNLWLPGGHQYQWNPNTTSARCYIMDDFHDIMRYAFKHLHSNWEEEAAVGVVSWYAMKPAYLEAKFNKEYFLQSDVGEKLGMGQDAHVTPYVRY